MKQILNFIDGNNERYLEELKELLRFESISSDPEKNGETRKSALWLKEHLNKIGFKRTEMFETAGHPIIYAEWLEAGEDAKTVLIYGHYDVQPVDPIELWNTPPFEPTIIDGKLYGRGTADDKGQLFALIKGVESHLAINGKLPLNVKLVIEGEEESGSSHFEPFIAANKELLKCDTVLIADTEWFKKDYPSICYALRGITYVEVKVVGPNRDLHSGTYGGTVDNPIQVLTTMIANLKDSEGRITIPGFYDNVLPLSDEERANFAKLPFDEEAYMRDLGTDMLVGEKEYTALERAWARPSLDVNGIKGGYLGEGAKTIIPSEASAKISMRLVPNQQSEDIRDKISKHFLRHAPKSVKVSVEYLHGGEPVIAPIDSPGIKAAIMALKNAFDKDAVFMREGGSIPVTATFAKLLNAPPVLMGFGLPDDNIHSPNEKFNLDNFFGGIKAAAIFLSEFAKI